MNSNVKRPRPPQILDAVEPTNSPEVVHMTRHTPGPWETGATAEAGLTPQEVSFLKKLIGRVGSEEVQRVLSELLK